ncbi:MAG: type 1 glutamine amidotransferase [Pseudomonadota bacterium]
MRIGILLAGHTPDHIQQTHGDFDSMFARLLGGNGFTFAAWDVEHLEFPDNPHDADGWLISGSRHGAYEDHAFIPKLEDFIRRVYTSNVPLVGICFGHQIIAQALGGTVEKFDGGWGLGRHVYETADGRQLALNAWHQDQVVVLPADASPVARNAFCENAMLVYGSRAFTVQAHPEFEPDLVADYITHRRGTGTYPDDRLDQAARALAQPLDNAHLGHAIATFLKTGVAHV